MENSFPWTCPYCNRDATITRNVNSTEQVHFFQNGNKIGLLGLQTLTIICPNPKCRDFEIQARLYKAKTEKVNPHSATTPVLDGAPFEQWRLKPKSASRTFPDYIPKAILDDYYEACLIMNDSAKASATLARRCLQGMIRDFWKITKSRLIDEIEALKGQIDAITWDAIDAVRSVGNIGAHMEKDINLIVDVDPEEARLLIGLIEFLLKDWYVARNEREEHKKRVIQLGAAKAAAKNPSATTP